MTTSSLKHYIILLSVVLGLCSCSSVNLNLLPEDTVALASNVQGVPRLLRSDLYRELGERASVAIADVVLTRQGEALSLDFRGNLKVRLGGASELVVHQYDAAARVFFLDNGQVRLDAGGRWPLRNSGPVEIVTTTGRVTLFEGGLVITSSHNAQIGNYLLLNGSAKVSNAFGSVLLDGRNQLTLTSFIAAPTAPLQAADDRVKIILDEFE